jgi:uncharacterized protein with GYD domain
MIQRVFREQKAEVEGIAVGWLRVFGQSVVRAWGAAQCYNRYGPRSKDSWCSHHDASAVRKIGRCPMATFMCFLNWTDQGAKAAKDVVSRSETTKALIAGLGGRMICGYVTTGQFDVVLVVEMPDGDAMTKLAIALQTRGNVRTTTVRAFSPEEFGKLAAEAP